MSRGELQPQLVYAFRRDVGYLQLASSLRVDCNFVTTPGVGTDLAIGFSTRADCNFFRVRVFCLRFYNSL